MLDEPFSVELAKQPVPEPHVAIDVKDKDDGDEVLGDAPPPFAPYEPEFFYNSAGDIISHDHHLNQDGEALYRFLLAQSSVLPAYILHVLGTHKERRTRTITTRNQDGSTSQRVENSTVTITDFSFYIDCSAYIVQGPIFWSYPDNAAVYRGLMVQQVDGEKTGRRKATKDEIGKFKSEEYLREDGGYPPWHYDSENGATRDSSSKTPREWADEYAASPKLLKEFVYEKTIHGWNPTALSASIAASIASTSYTGRVDATFTLTRNKIYIRPDNRLSRTLSSTLYKVLLIITLVFPFIWLFKRYGKRGGGKWEVIGAAYALKRVEVLDADENAKEAGGSKFTVSEPEVLEAVKSDTAYPSSKSSEVRQEGECSQGNGKDNIPPSANPVHNARIVKGERGEKLRVTGYREGEWFREWEPVIKRCAAMRLCRTSDEPLREIGDGPVDPRETLEGYTAGTGLDGY